MEGALCGGDGERSPLIEALEPFRSAPLLLLSGFSGTLGLSMSSLRKLDLRRRVRSATEGGFSGSGGAGPRGAAVG